MLEKMPADLFIRWIAYSRLNPFGEDRSDYRMFALACWNWNRQKPTWDFMRPTRKEFVPQTPEEQMEVMKGWTLYLGGSVN